MEGAPPETDAVEAARVGWQLVHLLQATIRSLEETSSRVLAAQVAGLIALWTQLYTFESGPPEVLAWIAWAVLLVSITALGALIRPRRVVRFWDRALPDDLFTPGSLAAPVDAGRIIAAVAAIMRDQREQLDRGLRISVPLGVFAAALAAFAYVVDKAFYPP